MKVAKEKAVRFVSHYTDFDGDVSKWKETFYTIWRYQMTWSFAYEIDLIDGHNGVFIDILAKEDFASNVRELLPDLGYGKITEYECKVGFVPSYRYDELDDVEMLILD